MELYNRLCTITKQENVMKDEPMKKHTTFRIGGPADYFVTPESREEIQAIVELCKKEEIPYSVIGNGSACSVLVSGLPGHCRPRGLADVVSFDIELISVKFKFRVGHGRSRFHVVIIAGELLFEKFARGHFLFWPRSHLSA